MTVDPSESSPLDSPVNAAGTPINRRAFLTTAGAVVGASLIGCSGLAGAEQRDEAAQAPQKRLKESSIKLSQRVFPNASDDYFLYCRQLGLKHLDVVARRAEYADAQALKDTVKRFNDNGFEVGNLHPLGLSYERSLFGQQGRDEEIAEYCRVLRDAGAAGFKSLLGGWRASRVAQASGEFSHREPATREAETVSVYYDPEKMPGLLYDRRYEADELWEHFAYWCRRVMPVAEDARVPIGMHPTGAAELGGVANLLSGRAAYERAFDIADSPMLGITLCVGAWACSPERYGPPAEAAYDFSKQGRIFHVHFRNISSPLPKFHETFMDNGYVDMSLVMKGLYEGGFDGTMHHDHGPLFVNDRIASGGVGIGSGTSLAYSVGYMRALIRNLETGWRPA